VQRLDVSVAVNGKPHVCTVEARRTLADFLRIDLGLTGTHLGCEHGACGACTVVVEGVAVRSCIMLAAHVDGCEVTTVEGLASDGEMHPIQKALWESHAFQCGFCTPGFLMSLYALYEDTDGPVSRGDLRDELSGNICRCSGYQAVIDGAEAAFSKRTGAGEEMALMAGDK
jgi:carbon-monoxide dehydrogenase small subunit